MENLDISCYMGSDDFDLFQGIVNQGIDGRLEAFTESTFDIKGNRLFLDITPNELNIFLRRLSEIDTDEACMWEDDIINCLYDVELD